MTISSFDIVLYTAYFVLPGYIIYNIIDAFVPLGVRSDAEKLVRCIGYSLIELALWYWCLGRIEKAMQAYWLVLLLAVLGSSSATGFVIGIILKLSLIKRLLSKIGLQVQNRIPTAWDYKFSSHKSGGRVTVALTDGTFIRGLYFDKSMASSDATYRDIYLEKCCMLNDKDEWVEVEKSDGVWIAPNSIKWINFMEDR